ncbi:fatty acid desaturase [Spinactinospora alkalitolerans]|uniref:Fatty acid desaturase n=1 Tax=Spinactinospora alkalitolerans TaxID=687207 RepID=A0A852U6U4_9ACTN|nr:hypothetical protein [Spinactinospora alkalitolerans]NYE49640.1 fatty acid desaturase [Spinactinospora alkalitolerans]
MAHNSNRSRYIRGYQIEGGAWAPTNNHRGRQASWVAVAFLLVGFVLAGLSLALGPAWWLLGVGVAAMVIGGILCAVSDIFTDVVLDDPRYDSEEPHSTPLHKIKRRDREIQGEGV